MEYRRLGRSGLKVSVLGFGSWVTFTGQLDRQSMLDCLSEAHDAGINLFDNAEGYGDGEAERAMGAAIAELGWPRHSYVVTSKYFWGLHDHPNANHTLNRKYLLEAVDGSLERFGLDHLDIIYCHRPDPETPIEETVWAMSDAVTRGKALYWGTSQWPAESVRAAWDVAERHHLHKPVVEQPQYSMIHRRRVEVEYARIIEDLGVGLTTWAALAFGLLTGKYVDATPEGSRATLGVNDWMQAALTDHERNAAVRRLRDEVVSELGCTPAQLAIAWCVRNPAVSSVILGASRVEQLRDNLDALDVVPLLTDDVMERIDTIMGRQDELTMPTR